MASLLYLSEGAVENSGDTASMEAEYCVCTVGINTMRIQKYIQERGKQD